MSFFCSLSTAARIVMWLVVVSTLLGLVLGYQAGSSPANSVGTGQPAAAVQVDAKK